MLSLRSHEDSMPTNSQDAVSIGHEGDVAADTLWGVAAIADFIGRTPRQTHYLICKKIIPARKRGHRLITASRSEIRRAFNAGVTTHVPAPSNG